MPPLVLYCLCFLFLLLANCPLHCQDISVDAVSAMHVCNEKNPADVGPCATTPRPLSKPSPSYPEKARQERKEGAVSLGLIVTKDGSVSDVHVVKGVDKDIDQAAIDAVSRWKFEAGTYQGNPVDVELTVTVNFRVAANAQQTPSTANLEQQKALDDSRNMSADAFEAFNRGDYATAVNLMRKVTSISPQNAAAWNGLGRALLSMNELDAAAQAFNTSIEKDPGNRDAYNNLGLVYWRQKKFSEAAAQFRKQIVINPDDHYAHRNLGMMLRDQEQCSQAMPELEKALSLTPNHADTLLAKGECDLDLGNRAKGVSELQEATSVSPAPNIFNSAAYALAKRNIEIDTAKKWSDTCLNVESALFQNFSLDHLTPEQLNYILVMAAYWDTRGWIYFLQDDYNQARSYIDAAWSVRANPTIGDHLGRIYERLGRPEDAVKIYAMAIASSNQSDTTRVDLTDLADAKKHLEQLTTGNADSAVKQAQRELSDKSVFLVANQSRLNASGDFAVRLSTSAKPEFRQLNGDKVVGKFTESLGIAKLPISLPESSKVEVALRGTLTCHSEETQCRFAFLSPRDAANLARNEMALASAAPTQSSGRDPHVYDDPAMGMRVFVPNQWSLVRLEPGSFSRPRNAMFGKSGSAAMFMLTRERFEGSLDLYQKMLDRFFSNKTEFKRVGEDTVKRNGITGTRWNVSWNENGIVYSAVIEMFGVGDDYYRVTTLAPKEVYDRYSETFENVLRSVQFPMLQITPDLLDSAK